MSENQQRIEELLKAIHERAILYIAAEESGDMQDAQYHKQVGQTLVEELLQILLKEYQQNAHEPASHN